MATGSRRTRWNGCWGLRRSVECSRRSSRATSSWAPTVSHIEAESSIFFPEFWRLHYFINDRFEEQLASYAQSAHPDLALTSSGEIVDHIEQSHHTALAFI